MLRKNAKIGSFIHHSVIKPENMEIGVGNIVFPFSILEKNTIVGNYNFLTTYCFISHDCVVGDNNFFSTAGIAGSVKVGDNNYFGRFFCGFRWRYFFFCVHSHWSLHFFTLIDFLKFILIRLKVLDRQWRWRSLTAGLDFRCSPRSTTSRLNSSS